MFKELLLVSALLATILPLTASHPGIPLEWQDRGGNHRSERFTGINEVLEYDEPCSWEAEEARQNYTSRIMTSRNQRMQMVAKLRAMRYRLCSAKELLVCDKESEKCVCGNPGHESLYGVNRSLYSLDEEGNCRLNTGTQCIPTGRIRNQDWIGLHVGAKCKPGTFCKTGKGEACDERSKWSKFIPSWADLLSDRVCTCEPDQIPNISNEWDEDEDKPPSSRDPDDDPALTIHIHYHFHYSNQHCINGTHK